MWFESASRSFCGKQRTVKERGSALCRGPQNAHRPAEALVKDSGEVSSARHVACSWGTTMDLETVWTSREQDKGSGQSPHGGGLQTETTNQNPLEFRSRPGSQSRVPGTSWASWCHCHLFLSGRSGWEEDTPKAVAAGP